MGACYMTEGHKMLTAILVAFALVLIVAIGGFIGFSIGGIVAGIAFVFVPDKGSRRRA